MRTWLVVLALAVTAAGIGLFVLSHERPAEVAVAPRDAAPAVIVPSHDAAPVVAATVRDAVVVDAPAASPPELETLRSTGSATETWVVQAATLLHGFDPAAKVECYVAGCAAALAFDSNEAYDQAVETIRTDETWRGGKKWLSAVRGGGKITAVLILYRPD